MKAMSRLGHVPVKFILLLSILALFGCSAKYINKAKKLAEDGYYLASVEALEAGLEKHPRNLELLQSFTEYQRRTYRQYHERGMVAYGARKYYEALGEFDKARKVPRAEFPVEEGERRTRDIVAKAVRLQAHYLKLAENNATAGALDAACEVFKLCPDCPKVEAIYNEAKSTAVRRFGAAGDEAVQGRNWAAAIEAYESLAKNQIDDYPRKLAEAQRKKRGFEMFTEARQATATGGNLKAVLLALRAKEILPEEPEVDRFIYNRKSALYKAQKKVVNTLLRRGRYDQAVSVLKYIQPVLPEYSDIGVVLAKAKKRRARQFLQKAARSESRRNYSAAVNFYLLALVDDPALIQAQRRLDRMNATWERNLVRLSNRFAKKNRIGEAVLLLAAARRVAPDNPAPFEAQRVALRAMVQKAQLDIGFWNVQNNSYTASALSNTMTKLKKLIRDKWGSRVNLIDFEQARQMSFRETMSKDLMAKNRRSPGQSAGKLPDFKINLTIDELDVKTEEKPMLKSASYRVGHNVPNEQYQILGQELAGLRVARGQVLAYRSRSRARTAGNVVGLLWSAAQGDWSDAAGRAAAGNVVQSLAYSGDLGAIDRRINEIEQEMVQLGATRTEYVTKTVRYTSTLHRRIAKIRVAVEILHAKTDAILFQKQFLATSTKEDTTNAGQPDANIQPDPLELPSESQMISFVMDVAAAKVLEQIEAAVRTRGDFILKSAVDADQQGDFERASELHMIFFFGPYDKANELGSSNSYSYFMRRLDYLAPIKATTDRNTLGFKHKK